MKSKLIGTGNTSTHCPDCGRTQPDRGTDQTCVHCGTSPVFSIHYPRASAFNLLNAPAKKVGK